jgi:hypothetical protein
MAIWTEKYQLGEKESQLKSLLLRNLKKLLISFESMVNMDRKRGIQLVASIQEVILELFELGLWTEEDLAKLTDLLQKYVNAMLTQLMFFEKFMEQEGFPSTSVDFKNFCKVLSHILVLIYDTELKYNDERFIFEEAHTEGKKIKEQNLLKLRTKVFYCVHLMCMKFSSEYQEKKDAFNSTRSIGICLK